MTEDLHTTAQQNERKSLAQKRSFVLGVGCQKGGTSWLHETISRHPRSNMGFEKEYHIWDMKWIPASSGFVRRKEKRAQLGEAQATLMLAMLKHEELYFDYFDNLRLADGSLPLVTGDITPAYAALKADHLAYIASRLEGRGFSVKPVFIMRDPVDRLFSMIRMANPKRNASVAAVEYARKNPNCPRTRYDRTVEKLDEVFGENVFYGFYENLFSAKELMRLAEFLELDGLEGDFSNRVRETKRKDKLKSGHKAEIRNIFQPVYDFCRDRFDHSFDEYSR